MEVSKDNWKHRSSNMKCVTCRFFVNKPPDTDGDRKEFGRCRKHAPTLNGWPAMFGDDWCGDHKLDENKL